MHGPLAVVPLVLGAPIPVRTAGKIPLTIPAGVVVQLFVDHQIVLQLRIVQPRQFGYLPHIVPLGVPEMVRILHPRPPRSTPRGVLLGLQQPRLRVRQHLPSFSSRQQLLGHRPRLHFEQWKRHHAVGQPDEREVGAARVPQLGVEGGHPPLSRGEGEVHVGVGAEEGEGVVVAGATDDDVDVVQRGRRAPGEVDAGVRVYREGASAEDDVAADGGGAFRRGGGDGEVHPLRAEGDFPGYVGTAGPSADAQHRFSGEPFGSVVVYGVQHLPRESAEAGHVGIARQGVVPVAHADRVERLHVRGAVASVPEEQERRGGGGIDEVQGGHVGSVPDRFVQVELPQVRR
mmetsp:Transcript_22262/g.50974  ORF Transcript_22262/g.50974 Transcript_22262/m.50974 type:complete len:345 (+) Transcript_22262:627-1661(+)